MTTTSKPRSATALREVPRPDGKSEGWVGRLVDSVTGETLVQIDRVESLTDRSLLMRWRTGHGRRTGNSVRPERYV